MQLQVKVFESSRDLGVVLDSQLSLSSHVAALCRAGFFHLRQIRPAIQSMTTAATRTAVQAFICCRLDYCKSLLYGMSDGLFRKIQSIQNAAARLVTGTRRCDHITSRRCCVNFTGFLFVDEMTTRLHYCMSGAPVASGSDTCIPG